VRRIRRKRLTRSYSRRELLSAPNQEWAIDFASDVAASGATLPSVEHGRFRDECLNASWFWNLWDARRKIACWRIEYNQRRPHSSLAYQTPEEFAGVWDKPHRHRRFEIPLRRNRIKAKPFGRL
jgi:transposase InsO family protein